MAELELPKVSLEPLRGNVDVSPLNGPLNVAYEHLDGIWEWHITTCLIVGRIVIVLFPFFSAVH